ncbi:MAG: S41 family peptidase [Candidatus Hydrogenedentota bacterium]|nr:MAG: S41 family peptidase [Candidatus Hydrogenedentota bacterium]
MKKRHSHRNGLTGFLLSAAAIAILLGLQISDVSRFKAQQADFDASLREMQVFVEAYRIVQADFADTTKLDPKSLIQGSIRGMLKTLGDPHTRYIPPRDAREMMVETQGEFGGIGIHIAMEEGRLTVISPVEGTPAWRGGVEAGDIIYKIDGDTTEDMTLDEAVSILRGPPGTPVTIEVLRRGVKKPIPIKLVREVIRVKSVRGKRYKGVGYIRISQFTEHTAEELDNALAEVGENVEGLILDLRNNPGGVLTGAIAVANRFLDTGIIVSIKARDPKQSVTYYASPQTPITRLPVVVLVNAGSASASEIVSGAIRDNHRGILVGVKTYGKGSVQTVENLPDGSRIALTTARYFTPSGVSIHGIGIQPDSEVKMPELSDTDKKGLLALNDTFLVRDFAWGKDTYTKEDVAALQKVLRKAGIILSDEIAEWRLVRELARRHADAVYLVPHLDPQLQKALDLIHAGAVVRPKRPLSGMG